MPADTVGPFLPPRVEADQILESRRQAADRRDSQRETRSAHLDMRIRPSLKARAEAVAARQGQTLSDYAHDSLEAAVGRAEAKERQSQD